MQDVSNLILVVNLECKTLFGKCFLLQNCAHEPIRRTKKLSKIGGTVGAVIISEIGVIISDYYLI